MRLCRVFYKFFTCLKNNTVLHCIRVTGAQILDYVHMTQISQAKGTNSSSFGVRSKVELVPLALEDVMTLKSLQDCIFGNKMSRFCHR